MVCTSTIPISPSSSNLSLLVCWDAGEHRWSAQVLSQSLIVTLISLLVCWDAGDHRWSAQVLFGQLCDRVRPLQLRPERLQGEDGEALHTQPHGWVIIVQLCMYIYCTVRTLHFWHGHRGEKWLQFFFWQTGEKPVQYVVANKWIYVAHFLTKFIINTDLQVCNKFPYKASL